MWIDSHIHLDAQQYEGKIEDELLKAQHSRVEAMILPSLDLASAHNIHTLSQQFTQLHPTVGIHPHQSQEFQREPFLKACQQLAPSSVAIGESGLEGHYDFVPLDIQQQSLEYHLQAAKDYQRPIILHCRETESQLYDILSQWELPQGGVIHCFTGKWEWAKRFLDLGFYIGLTGIVTFKNASEVHRVAKACPLNKLLVETDGPYMAPVPHRGKTNSPSYIPLIGEAIARLRGISLEEVASHTTQNTRRLFSLPDN